MKEYTSVKISNLSWICSILIVVIHSTTYAFNLPGEETATIYGKNVSTFVQMFFSEGVCRIAVPLFFIFSGYLFFQNFEFSEKCFLTKFRKRIFSLLIPFLFWSTATFLFFYIAQSIPATAAYFSSGSVVGIGLSETLERILLNSLNSPLWYLNDLMILALCTPLIYLFMKKLWYIALPATMLLGIFEIGVISVRGIGIFAFSLGGFIAIKNDMLQHYLAKLKAVKAPATIAFAVLWGGILLVKSWYLCTLPSSVLQTGQYTVLLKVLNNINIFVGITAVWLLYDLFALKRSFRKTRFAQYGMMLYVMHHPIISILKKLLIMVLGSSVAMSLVCYFLAAIITIFCVIAVSALLKKYAKGFYGLISGGR